MLDQIDLERTIDKPEYKARRRELQIRMYDLQQALFEARRPAGSIRAACACNRSRRRAHSKPCTPGCIVSG